MLNIEDSLREVWLKVVASGTVAVITALVLRLRKWRALAISIPGYVQRTGIRMVYDNPQAAREPIQSSFKDARNVTILIGRGIEITNRYYDPLVRSRKCGTVRFLVPDTEPTRGGLDWVEEREKELVAQDDIYRTKGHLKRQIEQSLSALVGYASTCPIEIRRYDAPYIGWIVITETVMYLTPATTDHFQDTKVFEYGRGPIYDMFSRYVDLLWRDSRPMVDGTSA